jgi:hypothetical protein
MNYFFVESILTLFVMLLYDIVSGLCWTVSVVVPTFVLSLLTLSLVEVLSAALLQAAINTQAAAIVRMLFIL